ncbi:hypothetical protein VOLCADRAFT_121772, partial [Volvox carteri f. nagariensis]
MVFSHSGLFLLSCDDMGRVKFSKPTLEVLQVYHVHKESCRSVSFSPSDFKFTTGSDDSTVRVFDTFRGQEVSMTGHGGDVRWVDWHPTKGVIASCSKDACVKLWDPRAGTCLSTLHGHKNGVFQVKWNRNGHWLLSCSRDQLVKLYDVRMLREVATFAGHGRDVTCVSWHPHHEELFVTGAIDGSLMMWLASRPDAQGIIPAAHDASVWTTAWHPLGHVLASAGADQKCQFWCRKRPGEIWQDVYGHDAVGTGVGTSAAVVIASASGMHTDGAAIKQGAGLSGPLTGSGVASVAVPGLGIASGSLGLGSVTAFNRPNVIPGIGTVLDQPSTTSQVLATAAAPGGNGSSGGGRDAGAGDGLGGATCTKRGREDGPHSSIRTGAREGEVRGESWGSTEWERGSVKVARTDGRGPCKADGGGGMGASVGVSPGARGYGEYVPSGLLGLSGADWGPGQTHMRREAVVLPSHYTSSYDRGCDLGSLRRGLAWMGVDPCDKHGRGAMQQGPLLLQGERVERREGEVSPSQYPRPEESVPPPYKSFAYSRGG